MRESTLLKGLESQLNKLNAEREILKNEIVYKQQNATSLNKQIAEIKQKIHNIEMKSKKKKELIVTEHAIIRYIERIMGINIEELQEKISSEIQEIYKNMGDGTYPIDGGKVKIKDGNIVTVLNI